MGSALEVFHSTDMDYRVDAVLVVHLAATPSPGQTCSSNQFRVNTKITYNVTEACRELGIKNFVLCARLPLDPGQRIMWRQHGTDRSNGYHLPTGHRQRRLSVIPSSHTCPSTCPSTKSASPLLPSQAFSGAQASVTLHKHQAYTPSVPCPPGMSAAQTLPTRSASSRARP